MLCPDTPARRLPNAANDIWGEFGMPIVGER
jgi:hypothetical protein